MMNILYGEKFDIYSLSDIAVIMSSDLDNFNIFEQAVMSLLKKKEIKNKDFQSCKRIIQKIRAEAIVEFIVEGSDYEVDNGDMDEILSMIEDNSTEIEKILKNNDITLFDVLIDIATRKFQHSDERWFILPNKYGFTVLIMYMEGEAHNTETFF